MYEGGNKGGAELFVSGLNLEIIPEKLHLRAWRYLFTGVMSNGELNPHDYFIWYKNSLLLVLILYLFAQKFIIEGMTAGSFKG